MVKNTFEVNFSSEVYQVKQVVADVMSFIVKGLPELTSDDQCDLKLIFSELLFNAVIHGNDQDINKSVRVFVEISEDIVFSIVSDEGFGFDYLKLLSNFDDMTNLSSESGRGIRLVYSLADSMAFNVSGNEIKFYKRVTSNG